MTSDTPQADYDNPWKEALQQYLQSFLVFCFPQVHTLIDWGRQYQSLDKELQEILREAESGKRIADKLFQVWLQNGEETWVLIHIEIQSQEESDFPKRMYQYHYRSYELHERPVISLAVLGDERVSWRPSAYGYTLGGCRLSLEFPIVKLLDYEQQWQTLEESNNPFAVLIMAHLKTKATTSEPEERKQWKWSLFRRLFERGYSREEIIIFFRCIDQMMALPEELETQFEQEVDKYQEDRNMPLLSRREERVKQEGIQQGIQQGTLQTLQELLINILQKQLGEIPPDLLDAINGLTDISFLRQLFERAFDLGSWEEFQQLLSSKNYEN